MLIKLINSAGITGKPGQSGPAETARGCLLNGASRKTFAHGEAEGARAADGGPVTQACRAETLGGGRTRILPFPACRALEEVGKKGVVSAAESA